MYASCEILLLSKANAHFGPKWYELSWNSFLLHLFASGLFFWPIVVSRQLKVIRILITFLNAFCTLPFVAKVTGKSIFELLYTQRHSSKKFSGEIPEKLTGWRSLGTAARQLRVNRVRCILGMKCSVKADPTADKTWRARGVAFAAECPTYRRWRAARCWRRWQSRSPSAWRWWAGRSCQSSCRRRTWARAGAWPEPGRPRSCTCC